MTQERHMDFDAFWSEQEKAPVTIKVFGKTYSLPPGMPASIMLYTLRSQAAGTAVVGAEVVAKMAEGLFGRAALDEIVAKGLTTDQLGDLIKYGVKLYQGGTEEATPTTAPAAATGA